MQTTVYMGSDISILDFMVGECITLKDQGCAEQICFGSIFVEKNSDSVRNELGSVQFEKRSSVRIVQLFTVYVIVEQLIYSKYYSITAMLNELCVPDFDTVVNEL